MRRIRALLSWLIYGGSFRLRDYEAALLERAAAELGDAEGGLLRRQIASVGRIKRHFGDRQVNLFLTTPRTSITQLADVREDRCRVRLTIESPAGRLHAFVITHRGILWSLEFSKRPVALRHEPLEVVSVTRDVEHRSIAVAADRLEHGRS